MKIIKFILPPILMLGLLSCQEQEDFCKSYRLEFSGKYDLKSIYAEDNTPLDLNRDGNPSANLLDEYLGISHNLTQSDFGFLKNKDGGYDGIFKFFCPLQHIGTTATSPFSLDTPITYSNIFAEYAINFQVVLEPDGKATWKKALPENTMSDQIYVFLLKDGEVVKAEKGEVVILIHEVPVYNCQTNKLEIHSLTYHLVHE